MITEEEALERLEEMALKSKSTKHGYAYMPETIVGVFKKFYRKEVFEALNLTEEEAINYVQQYRNEAELVELLLKGKPNA